MTSRGCARRGSSDPDGSGIAGLTLPASLVSDNERPLEPDPKACGPIIYCRQRTAFEAGTGRSALAARTALRAPNRPLAHERHSVCRWDCPEAEHRPAERKHARNLYLLLEPILNIAKAFRRRFARRSKAQRGASKLGRHRRPALVVEIVGFRRPLQANSDLSRGDAG